MLYIPTRHKPKFGNAGIIPKHPLRPLSAYIFNEGGGLIVYNTNKEKSDLINAPIWKGDYLDISGGSQYVINNNPKDLNLGTGKYTIIAFIATTASGSYNTVVAFNGYDPQWFLDASGRLDIFDGGGTTGSGIISCNDGKFHIIAWVREGTGSNEVKMYVDGILDTTMTHPDTVNVATVIRIGASSSGEYLNGKIKFIYLYNSALTGGEIASLSTNPWQWIYDKSEMLIRSVWAISGGLSLLKIINETEQIVENTSRTFFLLRFINETVTIVENAFRVFFKLRIVNETLNLIENVQRNLILIRIKNEALNLIENVQRSLNLTRIKNETLSLIETSLKITGLLKIVNEVITIGENVLKVLTALVVGPVQAIIRLFKKDTEYREFIVDTSTKVFIKKDKDKEFYVD